jgi:formylmethanofuran dehydrogenase subunit D
MRRYIETREPHIIGTVVAIDMLRRDGTEIPVYLALNTTDVDGKPWFVASIWRKAVVEPDTLPPLIPYQEGVNVRQDHREAEQNDIEIYQRGVEVEQQDREIRLAEREGHEP